MKQSMIEGVVEKYELMCDKKTKLVKPGDANNSRSDHVPKVFLLLSSADEHPNKPPDIICLRNLTNRGVRQMAGNAGSIYTVTQYNELLYAESSPIEERNPEISFMSSSASDMVSIHSVACGLNHVVCLASSNGRPIILTQGSNQYGQLGTGSTTDCPTFKSAPISETPIFVACGFDHTFVISTVRNVYAFGKNASGQLGIESNLVLNPTLVTSLVGYPISTIACGNKHSLALTTTGLLLASGDNSHGQLGFTSPNSVSLFSPVDPLFPVTFTRIFAHGDSSAAIDENGSLFQWGVGIGPYPKVTSLDYGAKFVDATLGNDGKLAALTSERRLLVKMGDSMVEICSPSSPFFRVFGCGDYFAVLAGLIMPQYAIACDCNNNILSERNFPSILREPDAVQTISKTFSSISLMNGSFLSVNFKEESSPYTCGVDLNSTLAIFDHLPENVLNKVTSELTKTLRRIVEKPFRAVFPCKLRFLAISLLHPSVTACRASFNMWENLISCISLLKAHAVLKEWFTHVESTVLTRILESLQAFLAIAVVDTPLYDAMIVNAVEAVEIVYVASNRTRALPFDAFYLDAVNKTIDIQTEFLLFNKSNEPWCFIRHAPWLLTAETKTRFVALNSRHLMNEQMQRAVSLSTQYINNRPAVRAQDLYFILEVGRDSLLLDTFRRIADLKNPFAEFRKPLKIIFKDEPGVDEGGVQREYFQLITEELFSKTDAFFCHRGDFAWFNENAIDPTSIQAFNLTGIIFGLAMYNGQLLNVRFPLALYRKMKGMSIGLSELSEFDKDLAHGLKSVLEYPGDVENDMGLSWEYANVELVPNGKDLPVTNSNRHDYVSAVIEWVFNKSVATQYEAFYNGFMQSAGSITLSLFRPEELALLITGREELDFYALEKVTRYEGFDANSPTVKAFWDIVHHRLSDKEKKQLLLFVTATPRAPIGGLGTVPFVIARDGTHDHIPTSHTCFSMLVLPDDPVESSLLRKLRTAIENTEGFQFK